MGSARHRRERSRAAPEQRRRLPVPGSRSPCPFRALGDRAVAQPRSGTAGFFLLPKLLNLRKHKISVFSPTISPWILSFCFTGLLHRVPEHFGVEGTHPVPTPSFAVHAQQQQQRHLVVPDRATNTSAAWMRRDQGSHSPSPQGHPSRALLPWMSPRGSLPSSCLQALCPGWATALQGPSTARTCTPSLEKHRAIPSSPRTPRAQTFPFHSSTLKFNFLHLHIIVFPNHCLWD